MRGGALLAPLVFLASQLLLVAPLQDMQAIDIDEDYFNNVEMLMPLLMSERSRAQEQRRGGSYSNIPAEAFTLDETLPPVPPEPAAPATPPTPPTPPAPPTRHSRGRKREQSRLGPRAFYVDYDESNDEDEEALELWRACSRLAQAGGASREALLYLCAELLDAAGPRAARPRCSCCAPPPAQRDAEPQAP